MSEKQNNSDAETKLDEVEAELAASLEEVILENLNIIPAAGGEITGKGSLASNSNNITEAPLPLSLQFRAQLPAEELLEPYYTASVPFNVGIVTAVARVEGTVVENDSSVNVIYDYFFNEVKVRYQKQF